MALGTAQSFIRGIYTLSFGLILIAMVNVYTMIVVYSLYQIMVYEDLDQAKSHINASNEGYQKCYETNDNEDEVESGQQTSEFNQPWSEKVARKTYVMILKYNNKKLLLQ